MNEYNNQPDPYETENQTYTPQYNEPPINPQYDAFSSNAQQTYTTYDDNNQPVPKKNGLGIASLVLGILGFLTGFLVIGMGFDLIAIILGGVAIKNKNQNNGMAIAGLTIGLVGLVLMIGLYIFSYYLYQSGYYYYYY